MKYNRHRNYAYQSDSFKSALLSAFVQWANKHHYRKELVKLYNQGVAEYMECVRAGGCEGCHSYDSHCKCKKWAMGDLE
jgi:hypothetical protein